MATNDELAARFPDLLGGAPQADRELIETVRALDALYAAPVPARLNIPIAWPADWQATTTQVGVVGVAPRPMHSIRPMRREADGMRVLRTADGKRWTGIVAAAAACLVVGLLAALLIGGHGGFGGNSPGSSSTQHGLLIKAQTSCASTDNAASCSLTAAMPAEKDIITSRLAYVLGVTNATLTVVNDHTMSITLPDVTDIQTVWPLLAQGNVTILDTGGTYVAPGTLLLPTGPQYSVMFKGTQIDPASVSVRTDPQTSQPVVTFAFAGSAQQEFAQYTARHIGQYLTLTLNDQVIESAVIQSEIDGSAQITGLTSIAQAKQAAAALKYGPLPVAFQMLLVQGSCPTPGPITPVPTATEPPNAPTPPPTYTPWPSSTPIGAPTATLFPPSEPGYLAPYPPAVIYECGTATPGPIGTGTPAGTPPPTPLPTPTSDGTSTPIPPTPTPIPTATPA